jgi:hypothetical protein
VRETAKSIMLRIIIQNEGCDGGKISKYHQG